VEGFVDADVRGIYLYGMDRTILCTEAKLNYLNHSE
jgi:hypothetical protein